MRKQSKKRKPNKQKNHQVEKMTWDSLDKEKQRLLGMVSEQQTFIHQLVTTELTEEDLNKEKEFIKTFDGLNKTYLDLLTRTLDISKEHGEVIEEKVVEGIKLPIVECQKGDVNTDDIDEVMKYQAILNKYAEVGFSLSSVSSGPMSELVFGVTEIKAKKENVNPEEVKELTDMKNAVNNFKQAMEQFNIGNIHTMVPTEEDIKKDCEKAVAETDRMIQEELNVINQAAAEKEKIFQEGLDTIHRAAVETDKMNQEVLDTINKAVTETEKMFQEELDRINQAVPGKMEEKSDGEQQ